MPISASVSTTPRTRSSSKAASIASPIGRSKTASQAASSPIRLRSPSLVGSGSVSVGNTRSAIRAVIAWNRRHAAYSRSEPVRRANDSRVRSRPPPISSPVGRPPRTAGVYEENRRLRSAVPSPRSATIRDGRRLTR